MGLKLIISVVENHDADLLRLGLKNLENITVVVLRPDQLWKRKDIDAIFLSLPAAERWGAVPIIHQAQVLKTKVEDRTKGWPPYAVSGVAMARQDPRDPIFELQLILDSVFKAVELFNTNSEQIQAIGFWAEDLGLRNHRIEWTEAGRIIRSFYEDWYSARSLNST